MHTMDIFSRQSMSSYQLVKRLTVILGIDAPLQREVLEYLLEKAGIEVVAHSSGLWDLLLWTDRLRPDVVFLWTSDPFREPGICSHLLQEYGNLKIVLLSSDECAILGSEREVERIFDPSVFSIRAAISASLSS